MVDWEAVKTEYENSPISMRKLSNKYSVSTACISRRAKKECWVKRVNTKVTAYEKIEQTPEDAIESMSLRGSFAAAAVATQKLEEFQKYGCDDPQALKAYMSVILDAQKAAGAFTGWTKREMLARIKQIEKQTADEEKDGTGVVVLPEILPTIPIKAESEAG